MLEKGAGGRGVPEEGLVLGERRNSPVDGLRSGSFLACDFFLSETTVKDRRGCQQYPTANVLSSFRRARVRSQPSGTIYFRLVMLASFLKQYHMAAAAAAVAADLHLCR